MSEQRQLRQNNDNRWDFLCGVLPNGINPTDIDLVYERKGQFLVLEGKREGAQMPTGQRRFYQAMTAVPQFSVVTFCGNPPDEVTSYTPWGKEPRQASTDDLRQLVKRWFEWVESGKYQQRT